MQNLMVSTIGILNNSYSGKKTVNCSIKMYVYLSVYIYIHNMKYNLCNIHLNFNTFILFTVTKQNFILNCMTF